MSTPEPCLFGDWCFSPIACEGFGYCRQRNMVRGVPDEETAQKWRELAAKQKARCDADPR